MRPILISACFAALTACGFQPVYAPSGIEAGTGSSSVIVDSIPGRSGHSLRRALLRELGPGLPGQERARLNVQLDERLSRLALQPDEAASRTDINATGRYVLDTEDGPISGRIQVQTSFNVPIEPFADVSAQADASERAMDLLARRIVDDIRLQLADRDT